MDTQKLQTTGQISLVERRYESTGRQTVLTGIQALCRLPIEIVRAEREAGRDSAVMIAGYEGSPLGGFDLELLRLGDLLSEHNIFLQQAVNEELAVNIVQGSQLSLNRPDVEYDGVVGFWYGKAPGLDRATDAIRHANLGGVAPNGGAVALVGDDALAKSSTVPSSSEAALGELGIPTLVPSDPAEVLSLGVHAVHLSRRSGLWSALKISTNVADGSRTLTLDEKLLRPVPPAVDLDRDGAHVVTADFVQPKLGELEASLFGERLDAARAYIRASGLNRIEGGGDEAKYGIVVAGEAYRHTLQALGGLGFESVLSDESSVRILKLDAVWPLVPEQIQKFAEGLDHVIVVEEKRPFVENNVKSALYGMVSAPAVWGRTTPTGTAFLPSVGGLNADIIGRHLSTVLPPQDGAHPVRATPFRRDLPVIPMRTPYFCSGCPHNSSTKVPEGTLVGAGIGCHGMVALMPSTQVGEVLGFTQMGGEGLTWVGMSPFVKTPHIVQNLGDGTYFHSGSLAIRGAVDSGVNITYKILFNSAVAMTGGQRPAGAMDLVSMVRDLAAEGVKRIVVTTDEVKRVRRMGLPRSVKVYHRRDLVEVQRELAEISGVTVLIHDQECATELRRKRKRGKAVMPKERVMINERVCEGCGDCGAKSNCLSVHPVDSVFGRKTQIHQASCNLDTACLDGDCPSFLTVDVSRVSSAERVDETSSTDEAPLPRPTLVASANIRMAGIGGTGVVTTAQVLAEAALIDGLDIKVLDQTGLAQKGGAVLSDLRIGKQVENEPNLLSAGEADLLIGSDALVLLDGRTSAAVAAARTKAVASVSPTPTGKMVVDTASAFPEPEDVLSAIEALFPPESLVVMDALAECRRRLGGETAANTFLVGVASQRGWLPMSPEAIEAALARNGVAVESNLLAFREGRRFVVALDGPESFHESAPRSERKSSEFADADPGTWQPTLSHEGQDLIRTFAQELVAYQSGRLARSYLGLVHRVWNAEAEVAPGSEQLTQAVARSLHKFMAYKDEYEVSRMLTSRESEEAVEREFGVGARVTYNLHPPVLRSMGMRSKLHLGPWARPGLVVLARLKFLRGTPLDFFGYAHVRRVERHLRDELIDFVKAIPGLLTSDNLDEVAGAVALTDVVRGYEGVKLANVERYQVQFSEAKARIDAREFDRR